MKKRKIYLMALLLAVTTAACTESSRETVPVQADIHEVASLSSLPEDQTYTWSEVQNILEKDGYTLDETGYDVPEDMRFVFIKMEKSETYDGHFLQPVFLIGLNYEGEKEPVSASFLASAGMITDRKGIYNGLFEYSLQRDDSIFYHYWGTFAESGKQVNQLGPQAVKDRLSQTVMEVDGRIPVSAKQIEDARTIRLDQIKVTFEE